METVDALCVNSKFTCITDRRAVPFAQGGGSSGNFDKEIFHVQHSVMQFGPAFCGLIDYSLWFCGNFEVVLAVQFLPDSTLLSARQCRRIADDSHRFLRGHIEFCGSQCRRIHRSDAMGSTKESVCAIL